MPIQEIVPNREIIATITGLTEEEVICLIDAYCQEVGAERNPRIIRPPTYLGGDLWEARVRRDGA